MRLRIVAVGPLGRGPERELVERYLIRTRRYCRCDEIELRKQPAAKLVEAFACATADATAVALDLRGTALPSGELAQHLERLACRGKGIVALLIGGADGLPAAVRDAAAERWRLSPWTLPHRLARVVLAEQLYRAMTILRGEPYSR